MQLQTDRFPAASAFFVLKRMAAPSPGVPRYGLVYQQIVKNPLRVNGNAMTTKIEHILSEKIKSGENAYLWLQSIDRDCILWPTQDASENEDSADEIGRWDLTVDEANELIETGEVNEVE
jgi:hypothetical protein